MTFLQAIQRTLMSRTPIIGDIKRIIPPETQSGIKSAGCVARRYERAGAAAISIVTEPKHFGGQPEIDIPNILESTRLPLLIKDFITTSKQIDWYSALISSNRRMDLSRCAFYLIAKQLRSTTSQLVKYLKSNQLTPFVSIHSENDLRFLRGIGDLPIIGINSKDIDLLETGPRRNISTAMVTQIRNSLSPGAIICESGHSCRDDIVATMRAGADGVIVGTALLQSTQQESLVRQFCEPVKLI